MTRGHLTEEAGGIFDEVNRAAANGGGSAEPAEYIDIDGIRYWRERPRAEVIDPMKAGVERPGYSRIVINIAPYAEHIMVDNRKYIANQIYEIRDDQIPTFLEIMTRTWWHERATQMGSSGNKMISPHNTRMNLQAGWNTGGPPGVAGN